MATAGAAMVTVGTLVYPLPGAVTVTAVTRPPDIVAVAVAVVPEAGAAIATAGALV